MEYFLAKKHSDFEVHSVMRVGSLAACGRSVFAVSAYHLGMKSNEIGTRYVVAQMRLRISKSILY